MTTQGHVCATALHCSLTALALTGPRGSTQLACSHRSSPTLAMMAAQGWTVAQPVARMRTPYCLLEWHREDSGVAGALFPAIQGKPFHGCRQRQK